MQRIVDLDAAGVIAAPIAVRIHGRDYTLPGDIPATLYIRLVAALQADEQTLGTIAQDLHDELLALFRAHDPTVDRIPLGLTELVGAITHIYGGGDEGTDGDPTPAATPAKKKPAKKKKPATRSRSST